MPIFSKAKDKVRTREEVQTLHGGHVVHFYLDPNPNLTPSYRRMGVPVQHDRAAVIELPGVTAANDFDRIIASAMQAGREAAIKPPGFDGAMIMPDGFKYLGDPKTEGGATATMVIYDPANFTLDIDSKGDSPAFVILDDGKKAAAVKVTSEKYIDPSQPGTIVNHLTRGIKRRMHGIYKVGKKEPPSGSIQLEQLIADAVDWYKLDRQSKDFKVHLLIASDGISKTADILQAHGPRQETMAAEYYKKARSAENKAAAIGDHAIRQGSDDNISIVLIEDIGQGKGKYPVATIVCDGFYKHGGRVADRAMQAIEESLVNEIRQAHAKPELPEESAEIPEAQRETAWVKTADTEPSTVSRTLPGRTGPLASRIPARNRQSPTNDR